MVGRGRRVRGKVRKFGGEGGERCCKHPHILCETIRNELKYCLMGPLNSNLSSMEYLTAYFRFWGVLPILAID